MKVIGTHASPKYTYCNETTKYIIRSLSKTVSSNMGKSSSEITSLLLSDGTTGYDCADRISVIISERKELVLVYFKVLLLLNQESELKISLLKIFLLHDSLEHFLEYSCRYLVKCLLHTSAASSGSCPISSNAFL